MSKEYRCVGGPLHGEHHTRVDGESRGYVLYKIDKRWAFPYYYKPERKLLISEAVVDTSFSGDHIAYVTAVPSPWPVV